VGRRPKENGGRGISFIAIGALGFGFTGGARNSSRSGEKTKRRRPEIRIRRKRKVPSWTERNPIFYGQ